MADPKLLILSGSLRKGSYNRMLLKLAAEAFGPAEVTEGDLDLPLYNGDLEETEGVPQAVQTRRLTMGVADGIVEADGDTIYQVQEMKVALSQE